MGFEPTTATLEGWSSSAELLPLEALRDPSRSAVIIAGRRGGVYRVSYTASPPLNWFDRLTMSGGDNTHCHSERSEESKSVGPLSVQVYPNRANRFYVQDCVSFVRMQTAFAQWLGILRRFTPQNDRRRAPCHSERSEESRASDRSAFRSTQIGLLRFYVQACESRLSECTHSIRGSPGILRRFTPQNDKRRAPCHSERSEGASDRSAFRSTQI